MNKNIFSKTVFFILVVVALSLFSFALVFAAVTTPSVTAPSDIKPVYPMGSVDSYDAACKAVTGSGAVDDFTEKCCGGNKLRSSDEPLCTATSLCDGVMWHSSKNPSQQGEVFKIPPSAGLPNMPYPIVNMGEGKPLVMCVDEKKFVAFRNARVGKTKDEPIGCVIEGPNYNVGTTFGEQDLDYLCPPNHYYAGGNTVPGAGNICRADHIVNEDGNLKPGPGYLFCNGWYDTKKTDTLSGMWGHAYLISGAGRSLPFEDDNSPSSERCPSQIGGPWLGPDGSPFGATTVIPCPGMVKVDNILDKSYVGPFGSGSDRVAGVCLPKQDKKPVYEIFLNNLNYRSAVINIAPSHKINVLGAVNKNEYLCHTVNREKEVVAGSSAAEVAICCGSDGCEDILGNIALAKKYTPGQSIFFNESSGGKGITTSTRVFCRSDGSWGLDLDKDAAACKPGIGGTWTGNYCCSEAGDDSTIVNGIRYSESYVDSGGIGSCVKNSFVANSVSFDFNRMFVSEGKVMGCSGDMWRTNDAGLSLKLGNIKVSNPTSIPGTSSDSAFSKDFSKSLMVWNGVTSGVYGQFINSDGSLSGSVFSIVSDVANSVRVSYSSVDKKFLVLYGGSSGVKGLFLTESGQVFKSVNIISGSSCFFGSGNSFGAVAYSASTNKFVLSCTKGNPTSGEVVVATISLDDSSQVVVVSTTPSKDSSVAVNGSQLVVSWSDATSRYIRLADVSSLQLLPPQKIADSGWIFSTYNSRINKFEIVYGNITNLFKRTLNTDTSLSAEVKVVISVNMSVQDVVSVPSRNSIFLVFPSNNFVGGLSIAELPSDNILSKPFDVAFANYTTSKIPVMNMNASISDFNGIPLVLMSRENALYAQPGGLGALILPNWPNPGGSVGTLGLSGSLVTYINYCSKISPSDSKFCDVDSTWQTSATDRSNPSVVPTELMNHFKLKNPNLSKNIHCCATNQCYDPSQNRCIDSSIDAGKYYNLSNGNVYRCIAGVWGTPDGGYKFTPDSCSKGFCAAEGQCLFKLNGLSSQNGNVTGNPQCINSGQFIGDALCLNGSWSSRTVLATNTLLKFTKNSDNSIKNYALVCSDSSSDVLVNSQYSGNFKNAYCVLDLNPGTNNNQRIIAVALAQDLEFANDAPGFGNDYMYSLKQNFLVSYPLATFNSTCLIVDGYTSACAFGKSQDDLSLLKLYYNSTSKIVVFSDKEIAGLTPTWQESVCSWLPSWLSWLCPSPPAYSNTLTNLTFDKIYSSKAGAVEVLGISKNRCEIAGGSKIQSYNFNYKGYSVSDVQNIIGTADLYGASEFSLIQGDSASSSKLIIKNPTNVDKVALWTALVSIRK